MKTSRFAGLKKVVVCGVIGPLHGNVHYRYGERSFNAQDMVKILHAVRIAMGPNTKIAIFWDNASIHKSKCVKDTAKSLEVKLVYNIAYRPDLNGIE